MNIFADPKRRQICPPVTVPAVTVVLLSGVKQFQRNGLADKPRTIAMDAIDCVSGLRTASKLRTASEFSSSGVEKNPSTFLHVPLTVFTLLQETEEYSFSSPYQWMDNLLALFSEVIHNSLAVPSPRG